MSRMAIADYEIGRDNIRFLGLDVHNPVFGLQPRIIAFVTGVLAFRDAAAGVATRCTPGSPRRSTGCSAEVVPLFRTTG